MAGNSCKAWLTGCTARPCAVAARFSRSQSRPAISCSARVLPRETCQTKPFVPSMIARYCATPNCQPGWPMAMASRVSWPEASIASICGPQSEIPSGWAATAALPRRMRATDSPQAAASCASASQARQAMSFNRFTSRVSAPKPAGVSKAERSAATEASSTGRIAS